jgi:hypothetical protein
VPSELPWPEDTWGIKLGSRVSAIRSQSTFVSNSPARRGLLDSIGFCWELPSEIKRRKKITDQFGEVDEVAVARGPKATPYKLTSTGATGAEEDLPQYDGEMVAALGALGHIETAARRIRNRPAPVGRIAGVPRSALEYDLTLIFEPVAYREIAAAAIHEHMMEREYSADPEVRQYSHFEGHLTPQDFNEVTTRAISVEDQRAMKKISYRILEFGRFNWDQVCIRV